MIPTNTGMFAELMNSDRLDSVCYFSCLYGREILTVYTDRKNTVFEQNPKEHARRARLWWEVAFLDRIQSLFYGRPSGITAS